MFFSTTKKNNSPECQKKRDITKAAFSAQPSWFLSLPFLYPDICTDQMLYVGVCMVCVVGGCVVCVVCGGVSVLCHDVWCGAGGVVCGAGGVVNFGVFVEPVKLTLSSLTVVVATCQLLLFAILCENSITPLTTAPGSTVSLCQK